MQRLPRPKINTVQGVVFGALPPLAYLLRPLKDSSPPLSPKDNDWTMVTPVARSLIHDFPLLPVKDFRTSSLRALGSIISSLKAIPNVETWPMTSTSIGLSQHCFDREATFCVKAEDLCKVWPTLPGSGGTVKTLDWYRDVSGVSHESVVLQVTGSSGLLSQGEETWWVCLERYPDGDFATLSRDKSQVIRRGSKTRAEMEFPNGISFAHVVRILNIIHEVSPSYFVIGANCWFYASTIVEMLDLSHTGRWNKGYGLDFIDHHVTKDFNYKQHNKIKQRVRDLVSQSGMKARPGSWCYLIATP